MRWAQAILRKPGKCKSICMAIEDPSIKGSQKPVHLSFPSPGDPGLEPYVKVLKNLEFMPPTSKEEISKVQVAYAKVFEAVSKADPKTTEGKQLIEMLGRNLCSHIKDRKVTEFDVHSSLFSLQAKANDFKASFAYSNTSLAQSLVGSAVNNLNKGAPQTLNQG